MKQDVYLAALRARRKKRAQALTEFAMILPVLLFFIMGIIDFGRVLFTYAQASAQLRSALRLASVVGYNTSVYEDCDLMRNTASTIFFDQSSTVTVSYTDYDQSPAVTYPPDGDCTNNAELTSYKDHLSNGDILRISNDITLSMMTPFFPSTLTFTLAGQRTLVTTVSLVNAPYAGSTSLALTQTENYAIFATQLAGSTQTAQQDTAVAQANQASTNVAATNYPLTETQLWATWIVLGVTPTYTPTSNVTPTATNTPILPQVQNLQFWPGGSKCATLVIAKRYPALVWTRLTGVQGYYIYADNGSGAKQVGKTTDKQGAIHQCGRSLKGYRAGRISGCYNVDWSTFVGGSTVTYWVAAYKANGAVIGPLSNPLTVTC